VPRRGARIGLARLPKSNKGDKEMSNDPGWDAQAIARIAKKKWGGFSQMFNPIETAMITN
jgi:hypothetical protein